MKNLRLKWSAAMAAVVFGCLSTAVEAKTLALLVGVADYDEANGIRDLHGPRNDVTIMWRLLKSRGADPADIAVLTDKLPAQPEFPAVKALPQYKNIVDELDHLIETAKPGDTVIFYYSGHGITQPDLDPASEEEPESDGQDQVLLPSDVGPYNPVEDGIKNGLVDDELGKKLSAIQAKGAFVWAIVDACHSGTVTRGNDVTRTVDPSVLGIPQVTTRSATRGGTRSGAITLKGDGKLVGFYAVDSYDQAIERSFAGYDLPMTGEGDTQRMGVFTYHLHRALLRGTAQTYRDLAQEVVADITGDRSGGRVPPPVFDGALDLPILGGSLGGGPPPMVAVLKEGTLTIPAGTLHGYDPGAKLAVYAKAGGKDPIGHAVIASATAATSAATKIRWAVGSEPEEGAFPVTVDKPAVTFRFAVAPPPEDELGTNALVVRDAIDKSLGVAGDAASIGIELAPPGDPQADLQLRVAKDRLWIVRPERPWVTDAGSFDETPSLAIGSDAETLAEELKESVWLLARAAKLVRVTGAASEARTEEGYGVEISANVYRDGAKGADARAACAPKGDTSLPKAALSPLLPYAAGNCDYVEISVSNPSDYTYYVGGFYVDALGGVSPLIPKDADRGCVRKLPSGSGGSVTYKFKINTWDAARNRPAAIGVENAVVLAIPEDDTKIAPRLCSLVQPTLDRTQATRSADTAAASRSSGASLKQLLDGVTGSSTRAATVATSDEDSGPQMGGGLFVFDVRP
ncbi:MAG: caspase family protein [Rhizobiales bacterium]|nr:caspase family protein [Hyphomicrobiales bacterium]